MNKKFTDDELDRLDGIFAHDSGCASSGIKDDSLKSNLRNDKDKLELMLFELIKQYVNSDQGYSFEDVAAMVQWAEGEFDVFY